ncbi:unnamed protein product [Adineta ricciae]|uniref:Uncharacterized protein n=1 Tax=Adineta ricciae TaxID=249248 RepID=A0A815KI65_ADIRI|nr:unnamed protein product [Adineta ricciae]CAF1396402.1 unnamed protein product [Adineta ricciae]
MSRRKGKKQVETLAWITDDEAEFWTSITPNRKIAEHEKMKKYASDNDLPDGDHFRFDRSLKAKKQQENLLEKENQRHSADNFNSKKNSLDQVKEINEENQHFIDKPTIEREKNDKFFSRLIQELKGSSIDNEENVQLNQQNSFEDYQQISTNDVIANQNQQQSTISNEENETNLLFDQFHSFIDEITEESFVITGSLDEDTLLNRRSRRAKGFSAFK